jgi:hypothetical protein
VISPGRRNWAFRVRNQPKTAGGASRKKFSAPPRLLDKAALDITPLQASGPPRLAFPAVFRLGCGYGHPPEIVWSVDPADANRDTVIDHKSRAGPARLAVRGAWVQALEFGSSRFRARGGVGRDGAGQQRQANDQRSVRSQMYRSLSPAFTSQFSPHS